MTQNLIDQLDLHIYSLPFSFWWRHPLVMIGFALLFAMLAVAFWFTKRRFRKKIIIPFSVIALHLLKKGKIALIHDKIDISEASLLLTTVLKSYTAWLTRDETIKGMTDRQWILFIKTVKQFEPYYDDCNFIVETVNQIKFNYAQFRKDQVILLFEKAIQIVDRTNVGNK